MPSEVPLPPSPSLVLLDVTRAQQPHGWLLLGPDLMQHSLSLVTDAGGGC